MPQVRYIEKTIFEMENVRVDFLDPKTKRNVRDDLVIQRNYSAQRMTKNSATVSFLKGKLQAEFPGYDFDVYMGDGSKASGGRLLGGVRDSYLNDD